MKWRLPLLPQKKVSEKGQKYIQSLDGGLCTSVFVDDLGTNTHPSLSLNVIKGGNYIIIQTPRCVICMMATVWRGASFMTV